MIITFEKTHQCMVPSREKPDFEEVSRLIAGKDYLNHSYRTSCDNFMFVTEGIPTHHPGACFSLGEPELDKISIQFTGVESYNDVGFLYYGVVEKLMYVSNHDDIDDAIKEAVQAAEEPAKLLALKVTALSTGRVHADANTSPLEAECIIGVGLQCGLHQKTERIVPAESCSAYRCSFADAEAPTDPQTAALLLGRCFAVSEIRMIDMTFREGYVEYTAAQDFLYFSGKEYQTARADAAMVIEAEAFEVVPVAWQRMQKKTIQQEDIANAFALALEMQEVPA